MSDQGVPSGQGVVSGWEVSSQGVWCVAWARCLPPCPHEGKPPTVDIMTDKCKNITFPILHMRLVNMYLNIVFSYIFYVLS